MACSVECLNFFDDCYKSPNKSLYAELPNSLILKIIQEADGGRYTHKLRLKQVHQEMRDIIARSMNNYQDGVEAEDYCSWRPINKSEHSQDFWEDLKMNNIEWGEVWDNYFSNGIWDRNSRYMRQDSIISLWCIGDDLSIFSRIPYTERFTEYIREGGDWEELTWGEDQYFIIYQKPSNCPRYGLQ